MYICAPNIYRKNSTVFAYRNNIYMNISCASRTCMHMKENKYIYIDAYMYIHVGDCVHVPIEHVFRYNGRFVKKTEVLHKFDALRIFSNHYPFNIIYF